MKRNLTDIVLKLYSPAFDAECECGWTDDAFVLTQGDTVYATVVPEVDEKELENMVNPIVKEYFEHGDTKEVQVNE